MAQTRKLAAIPAQVTMTPADHRALAGAPGASVDTNIEMARGRSADNPLGAAFWFRKQVPDRAPWDYKQQGREYQAFGNFNFGATIPISSVLLITGVRAEFDDRHDQAAVLRNGSPRLQWSGRELRIFKGQAEPVETPTAFKSTPLTYWAAD